MCLGPAARAGTDQPNDPTYLLFAGTDVWRDGAFFHGGLLWSPAGLDADGFTLKVLLSAGNYTYPSGAVHMDVDVTMLSAAAMPGWRMTFNGVYVGFYAGPLVQDYRLTPNDPGSTLRGLYVGAELAADLWYQPTATTMVALNGFIAPIGPTGSIRAAFGWRYFEPFFIGPETQGIWCADYQQLRFGAHITAFRVEGLEWSASAGWAIDSDGRVGPYLRLGFIARY
jgi:hypothetical protein